MQAPSSNVSGYARGRVPAEVRREQLLGLAEELFAARGYGGVSMEAVADHAGVTKPVVYRHFANKEELFLACVERSAVALGETVREAAGKSGDPLAQLREASLAFFSFAASNELAWSILFGVDQSGPFAAEAERIRSQQNGIVAELLARAAELRGADVDAVKVGAIAQSLNGAYEALARWWEEHPETTAETLADWIVELTYPGLLAMATGEGLDT